MEAFAVEYDLELSILQDPTALPLLCDCSAALEAEKESLQAHVMAAPSTDKPTPELVAVVERLQGVLDRLAELQSLMESGELTMAGWCEKLLACIERDTRLVAALQSIDKGDLAEEVSRRLLLAEVEAAELATLRPCSGCAASPAAASPRNAEALGFYTLPRPVATSCHTAACPTRISSSSPCSARSQRPH